MSIGTRLREAREARGVTLEQAERETRIIRRYLIALEEEDFNAFPAEVYARGFLRSYANYLGLNPEDLVKALPRLATSSGSGVVLEPRGSPRQPETRSRSRHRAVPAARSHPSLRLAGLVAAGLLIAALVGRLLGGAPDPALLPPDLRVATPMADIAAPTSGQPVAGRMPDLIGAGRDEALRRLAELGVTPFVIEVPCLEGAGCHVIRQSPAPHKSIGSGPVVIVVGPAGSRGSE